MLFRNPKMRDLARGFACLLVILTLVAWAVMFHWFVIGLIVFGAGCFAVGVRRWYEDGMPLYGPGDGNREYTVQRLRKER